MNNKSKDYEHRGYQPMATPSKKPSGSSTTYQGGYQPKTPQTGKLPKPPVGTNSQDG